MTESNPQYEQFLADQKAAEQEAATRDEMTWDIQVQTAAADLEMKDAHTTHTLARARTWSAVSSLLNLTWAIVLVVAAWMGTTVLIETIRGLQ